MSDKITTKQIKRLAIWEPTCPLFREKPSPPQEVVDVMSHHSIECHICEHLDVAAWWFNIRHPKRKKPECKAGADIDRLYQETIAKYDPPVVDAIHIIGRSEAERWEN